MEDFDKLVVHPDKVIRQELFTSHRVSVKSDLKKLIPGQLTRQDYAALDVKISGSRAEEKGREEKDLQELYELSRTLSEENIKQVVNLFDNLKEIPLSSR